MSITAGPDIVEHHWAIIIGAAGGVLCTAGIRLLEVLKIDDVVGAVPAHLVAGMWGTLAVCIAAGGNVGVQLLGIVAIGVFVFLTSWTLWLVIDKTIKARVSQRVEELGQDVAELGIEAYPEFLVIPDADDIDELKPRK